MEAALEAFRPEGDVLELACGTGLWTRHLASTANRLTALDGSPEALALARRRVPGTNVTFELADIFSWEPRESYDVCFFGFWLSHVPGARLDAFWEKVRRALRPDGRVFFVDSLRSDLASAADHIWPGEGEETMLRRLSDGREYLMVKRFDEPRELERRLGSLGLSATVRTTGEFFLYGEGSLGG